MTREEIINGLKMSMELTLFDPSTGEVMEPYQLNDINRTAYEAYKGAIELLEKQPDTTTHDSIPAETGQPEPCQDTISRTRAIDVIKKRLFETAFNNIGIKQNVDETLVDVAEDRLETWFDDVPTIQSEQQWVPCSERQPDKEGDYLVTLWDDGRTWVEIALWNETFGGRWQAVLYNEVDYSDISNVVAWLPLPEPYQGEVVNECL